MGGEFGGDGEWISCCCCWPWSRPAAGGGGGGCGPDGLNNPLITIQPTFSIVILYRFDSLYSELAEGRDPFLFTTERILVTKKKEITYRETVIFFSISQLTTIVCPL